MNGGGNPIPATVEVWDPLVRAGHWLLVASVVLSWFTRHGGGDWHEILGYVALAIVGVRLVWGFTGPVHARFARFVRGPASTLAYARDALGGTESRYLGHNPLGAWMIVALIAAVLLAGGTGWLYTTDRYWGVEWVETLHRWSSNLLFALAGVHVLGVLYASWRHRENLIAAMIHGRKPE